MDGQNTQYETPKVTLSTHLDVLHQLECAEHLLDAIGDGLLVVNQSRRLAFCNETAKTLLGQDVLDIAPEEWETRYTYLLPDASRPVSLDQLPLMRAFRGETVTRQEMHVSGPNIRNVWISVTARPMRDVDGRFEWAYIILRDTNLRKWSEEAMQLRERAMGASREGIVIIDARSQHEEIIYVNEGFEQLTGYAREEIVSRTWRLLFETADDRGPIEALVEPLHHGESGVIEIHYRRKDGEFLWIRFSITPVRDQSGQTTHYIAVLSDITVIIETERRLEDTTRQLQEANRRITWANERMKRNLRAAARVQRALLPSSLPEIEGAAIAWAFRPNEELSGDILNVIQLDEHHVGLYLLDVSGHGVASAMASVTVSRLLMPVASATALVYEHVPGASRPEIAAPSKVATRLDMRFQWDAETGQFLTMVYGVLDCRTGEFRYTCAGHPSPLLITEAGESFLSPTENLPIGLGQHHYTEHSLVLSPRSRLYLYSDGITEAAGPNGQLYGPERLLDVLRNTRQSSLQESVDSVIRSIEDWRGGAPIQDDVSLLAVEMQTR